MIKKTYQNFINQLFNTLDDIIPIIHSKKALRNVLRASHSL